MPLNIVFSHIKPLSTIHEIQIAFKKFYSHLLVYTSVQIKKHINLTRGSYSALFLPPQPPLAGTSVSIYIYGFKCL
jgi:hypothetical protein